MASNFVVSNKMYQMDINSPEKNQIESRAMAETPFWDASSLTSRNNSVEGIDLEARRCIELVLIKIKMSPTAAKL